MNMKSQRLYTTFIYRFISPKMNINTAEQS